MTTPIPSPPAIPFLGHVATLDKEVPLKSIDLLAHQYGEIYQLNYFGMFSSTAYMTVIDRQRIHSGEKRVFVSSYNLLKEISDEKRFSKKVTTGLKQVRNAIGDGLFTVCQRLCQ